MITGYKRVVLVDVKSIQKQQNGDRYFDVEKYKVLSLKVDIVGLQTMQLGQAVGQTFSFSIEIPRIQYDNERYCFFESKLYEIKTFSKAKKEQNMLLVVSKVEDEILLRTITKWLEENL